MGAVFRALADPTRRRVLQLLRDGPKTAGQLAVHFPVSKPTMSAHFAVLREADLILGQRRGKVVTYQLRISVLEEALREFATLLALDLSHGPPADSSNAAALEKQTI